MALARRRLRHSLDRNTGASSGSTRCLIVCGFILPTVPGGRPDAASVLWPTDGDASVLSTTDSGARIVLLYFRQQMSVLQYFSQQMTAPGRCFGTFEDCSVLQLAEFARTIVAPLHTRLFYVLHIFES